jgi:hypothetical protein
MPASRRIPLALSWLGKLWTSPNTLLGLGLGLLGLPFGARFRRGENAVNVLEHPLLSLTRVHAITFGNAVLYRRGVRPEDEACRYAGPGAQRLGDHERAHTLQYELWGPFFLPVYLLLALLPGIHRLERQADRWAERGRSGRPTA